MSRDNYNPYRIVGAKKIDVWFYEEGDMRRTHRIVYELIVLPLYGVCENSFLDYRHHSDELLELFIQPPYIEVPLWLMVMTGKKSNSPRDEAGPVTKPTVSSSSYGRRWTAYSGKGPTL